MAALSRTVPWLGRALGALLAAACVAVPLAAQTADGARPSALPPDEPARELVVLAHGMGRTPLSMRPLKRALEAAGYDVLSFGYSSYCCSIAQIGESMRRELEEGLRPHHTKVHFVGHSLGNIIVRYVLTRDTIPPRVGRVVMLAPPNQGAHAANAFAPMVSWLLRPVAELQADSGATVRRLPRVRGVEIGIIAARDDRTVKLPETHLPEESGHIVVGGGHSLIMYRDDTKKQMLAFLRTGQFLLGTAEPVVGERE